MKLMQSIGKTPLVELDSGKKSAPLLTKLEEGNQGESAEYLSALHMIRVAFHECEIYFGDTLIEATSGNSGIALAIVAAQIGVKIILVIPDNSTEEHKQTMRAYGAELILTPTGKTIEYSRELTLDLAKEKGYKILNRFE